MRIMSKSHWATIRRRPFQWHRLARLFSSRAKSTLCGSTFRNIHPLPPPCRPFPIRTNENSRSSSFTTHKQKPWREYYHPTHLNPHTFTQSNTHTHTQTLALTYRAAHIFGSHVRNANRSTFSHWLASVWALAIWDGIPCSHLGQCKKHINKSKRLLRFFNADACSILYIYLYWYVNAVQATYHIL